MHSPNVHSDREAFLRYLAHLMELRAAGQPWPAVVFEAMVKVMAHCSWEPIPTRLRVGKLQFLYCLRSADDVAYSPDSVKGRPWYFGGSYNRGEPASQGLCRVEAHDFKGRGRLVSRQFAGCVNWHREPRGPDVGLVFLCCYEGETPPDAQWFDWDQPPEHMIEGHRILVERVIQAIRDEEKTPWFLDDPR